MVLLLPMLDAEVLILSDLRIRRSSSTPYRDLPRATGPTLPAAEPLRNSSRPIMASIIRNTLIDGAAPHQQTDRNVDITRHLSWHRTCSTRRAGRIEAYAYQTSSLAFMGVVVLAGVTYAAPQPAKKDKKSDPGDLGARWWQLVSSLPPAVNPFLDETKCGVGRAGPVWFLYSTAPALETIGDPTDVTCTIPAAKNIFLS
jgi:hypothetical protein